MRIDVPIVLLDGASAPEYHSEGAAGIDLRTTEDLELQPMGRCAVPTGIKLAIPEGFEGQVRPRSGLASRYGITMVNSPGTIDSDYRGEIKIILINLGESVVRLSKGDRVAQLVFCPIARASFVAVDDLGETLRGEGGFGSTGI